MVETCSRYVGSFRVQWDNLRADSLSKLFLQEWETPLPKNNGVCFRDVYLNTDWIEAAKKPENDCYIRVDYPFYYESLLEEKPLYDLEGHKAQLRLVLESLYYDNEFAFEVKLCAFHAAFQKVCTSKIIFEVGRGGDGKGMEAHLERGLFGDAHSATLDCGVFLDRMEFRKGGEFAWNKSCLGYAQIAFFIPAWINYN